LKIVIKNSKSLLHTENKDLLTVLRKKYSAKPTGYQYSKAYKSRGWDGSTHFITSRGFCGTGLVPFIIEDLKKASIAYELVDERSAPLDRYNIDIPKISYRPYQKKLIRMALDQKGALVEAPTGSGKTIIMAGILKALEGKKGLIFFTQKSILLQTYKFLKNSGFDVGIAFGDGVDIKPVTLCTIQSINKVIDTHLDSDFIMFDEVHEFSKGKVAISAIRSFPNALYRFGMSATIPKDRLARLNLVSYLGGVISEVDVMELVEHGFLTPPTVTFIQMPKYKDHSLLNLTYFDIYEECIINNEYRNKKVRELCLEILKNKGRILILVKNLKHLEILKDLIPGSVTLEGKDNIHYREEVIENFKSSNGSILIGTKIMQTGIDIPEITHLINARGLKSEIATIQALGRALRIHESKNEVQIYDFNDEVPYLKEHSKARRRAYKSLKVNIYDTK